MKMVDLGFGAVAIEPDPSRRDTVSDLDLSVLIEAGVSDQAISIYRQFGRGLDLSRAAGSAGEVDLTQFTSSTDFSDL